MMSGSDLKYKTAAYLTKQRRYCAHTENTWYQRKIAIDNELSKREGQTKCGKCDGLGYTSPLSGVRRQCVRCDGRGTTNVMS